MELTVSFRVRPPELSVVRTQPEIPNTCFRKHHAFTSQNRRTIRETSVPGRKCSPKIAAKSFTAIEGVGEELNDIASQDLDFAPSRRRARSAFAGVQQQLDHFLFRKAPTGIRTNEWYEKNSRDLEIFSKSWLPEPGALLKGALFFCHGYGDTCTFFFEGIAKRIAASGYCVYALDYPGFGLSDGLHGYIPSFDELVDGVVEHYTKIRGRPELRGLPHFMLGQSMGGAVGLKIHLRDPHEWDGIVLVAPMCKIAEDMKPSAPVLNFFTFLSNFMPKAKLFPTTDLAELAFRDSEKRKMAEYNVISYSDQTRLKTAVELLKVASEIESRVHEVSCPMLILHGGGDRVTDPLVSRFLFEKASSPDKTLKVYEGSYHSILEGEADATISAVLHDIISWLDAHCSCV